MLLNLDQPASVKGVLAEFPARRRKRVLVCLGLCAAALVAGFSISSTAVGLSIMVAMVIFLGGDTDARRGAEQNSGVSRPAH